MTTVLIATNEPVLASGFEAILNGNGLEIADICFDVVQLFDCVLRCRPEIAILDIEASHLTDVVVELRRVAPKCQLLIWPRQISMEQAQEVVRLGARGVLPLNVKPAQLVETLDMLANFPIPERTPAVVVQNVCSASERKLIALVGCGMKNVEIAAVMRSDEGEVDSLVRTVSRRLGVRDRYELALYGLSVASEAAI
jgi:DNA-binding NarL/FixJ family response regulator